MYFLSFLSTVVLSSLPPPPSHSAGREEEGRRRKRIRDEREREREERFTGMRHREEKESGQCSRKLASKSCGRNERRTPLSPLDWRPQPSTTTFSRRPFPSGSSSESLRWREWETAVVGNGAAEDERAGAGGGRGGMEGHCRRRGGLRPTPRKSARQLCGTDFHKLHSMGHRYKEGIKRGKK